MSLALTISFAVLVVVIGMAILGTILDRTAE